MLLQGIRKTISIFCNGNQAPCSAHIWCISDDAVGLDDCERRTIRALITIAGLILQKEFVRRMPSIRH